MCGKKVLVKKSIFVLLQLVKIGDALPAEKNNNSNPGTTMEAAVAGWNSPSVTYGPTYWS